MQAVVNRARGGKITRLPRFKHLSDGGGGNVARRADETGAAQGHKRQAEKFEAAPDQQFGTAQVQYAGEVLEVPGGFLHPDEVVEVAKEAINRLGRDIDGGAARHVVGHDGQVGKLLTDGFIPDVQRLLGWAGVVRRDDQCRVDTGFAAGRGQFERVIELGRAGSGHKVHPAVDGRSHGANRGGAFGVGLRTGLTGRPTDRNAV